MRRKRGFVQLAILYLLKEKPMHGYQIMKELEERSNGAYTASAGTVYPALQELQEKLLIELDTDAEKKIYSITKKGLIQLEEGQHAGGDFWVEWKERMTWKNSAEFAQLRTAMERWEKELRKAVQQTRGNSKGVHDLIATIDEMTEHLKKNSTK